MTRRPTRGDRRRARRRQEDDEVVDSGSCALLTSLVLYPVGSLAAFVIALTGTRVTPVTLEQFGRTQGGTVESMRLRVQGLNGGPVSALEMVILAAVLFVVVPGLLWYLITRRPRRVLIVMFFFTHPKFTAVAQRRPSLRVVEPLGAVAVLTLGLWLPPLLAVAVLWAPPQ